ncbi:hypothetical protein GGX14DRAFT_405382 [Mycena pura]|uniref:Uncharacterized protein n=1 Tax=Mycena pura TaxID=153505 RepID=A0AAD6Y2M0_9AGAR|nr:hypothetical protein GGX14DRAFT_405382 [Mycena pura]
MSISPLRGQLPHTLSTGSIQSAGQSCVALRCVSGIEKGGKTHPVADGHLCARLDAAVAQLAAREHHLGAGCTRRSASARVDYAEEEGRTLRKVVRRALCTGCTVCPFPPHAQREWVRARVQRLSRSVSGWCRRTAGWRRRMVEARNHPISGTRAIEEMRAHIAASAELRVPALLRTALPLKERVHAGEPASAGLCTPALSRSVLGGAACAGVVPLSVGTPSPHLGARRAGVSHTHNGGGGGVRGRTRRLSPPHAPHVAQSATVRRCAPAARCGAAASSWGATCRFPPHTSRGRACTGAPTSGALRSRALLRCASRCAQEVRRASLAHTDRSWKEKARGESLLPIEIHPKEFGSLQTSQKPNGKHGICKKQQAENVGSTAADIQKCGEHVKSTHLGPCSNSSAATLPEEMRAKRESEGKARRED